MSHPSHALFRCVRATADAVAHDERTDRELLDAFRAGGDQAAFAALIRRHGPMVLAACRRILRDPTDAEDAFQATFLALLRKADTIRDDRSLGGWLFRVARHVALESRRSSDRRQLRERRHDVPTTEEPADLSWREACAVLHEELDRLPGSYRLPLLLCYLEGHTRDEAARQLGLSTGSVIGRLERGRKLLKQRLAKRGIALSAGLLAAVADSATATGLPSNLTRSTLSAAAGGTVPASVAHLIDGVPTMTANNLKYLVALTAAAGLALAIGFAATGRPNAGAAPPSNAQPNDEAKSSWSGRVLDPEGKPIGGAKIAHKGKTVATSDAEGRFAFDAAPPVPGVRELNPAIASADGFAPDWAELRGTELTFRLASSVAIEGRVLDLEGKPVVGAVVTPQTVETTPEGNLDAFVRAWKNIPTVPPLNLASKHLYAPKLVGLPESLRTDKDGRFELSAARERMVALRIEGDGIETVVIRSVTRPEYDPRTDAPAPEAMAGYPARPRPTLYGPTFDHIVRPSQPIVGTVRDAASGKPLAGVSVGGSVAGGWWENNSRTVTDANGRYRLVGIPKAKQRTLVVFPGEGSPYLQAGQRVGDSEGLGPIAADIELVRGVVVSGRLTDKVTGKPVLGSVMYEPLAANDAVRKMGAASIHNFASVGHHVDPTGRFAFTVPPGPGLLIVSIDERRTPNAHYVAARIAEADKKYASTGDIGEGVESFVGSGGRIIPILGRAAYRVLDPANGAEKLECDIQLDPGTSVNGVVRDPEGKPLSGTLAAGLKTGWDAAVKLSGDTFTARALDAKPRTVAVLHAERQLTGTATVSAGSKEPVTVTTKPCGTLAGRLVDAEGKPMAGVGVVVHFRNRSVWGAYALYRPDHLAPATDADGRFRIDGLFPDEAFAVLAARKGLHFDIGTTMRSVKVGSGEVKELGTVSAKPYEQ